MSNIFIEKNHLIQKNTCSRLTFCNQYYMSLMSFWFIIVSEERTLALSPFINLIPNSHQACTDLCNPVLFTPPSPQKWTIDFHCLLQDGLLSKKFLKQAFDGKSSFWKCGLQIGENCVYFKETMLVLVFHFITIYIVE